MAASEKHKPLYVCLFQKNTDKAFSAYQSLMQVWYLWRNNPLKTIIQIMNSIEADEGTEFITCQGGGRGAF